MWCFRQTHMGTQISPDSGEEGGGYAMEHEPDVSHFCRRSS
jgi:hypothetical protein